MKKQIRALTLFALAAGGFLAPRIASALGPGVVELAGGNVVTGNIVSVVPGNSIAVQTGGLTNVQSIPWNSVSRYKFGTGAWIGVALPPVTPPRLPAPPPIATSIGAQVSVTLATGISLAGVLVEEVPGRHISIRLPDASIRIIAWIEIRLYQVGRNPPVVVARPPAPPAPGPVVVAQPQPQPTYVSVPERSSLDYYPKLSLGVRAGVAGPLGTPWLSRYTSVMVPGEVNVSLDISPRFSLYGAYEHTAIIGRNQGQTSQGSAWMLGASGLVFGDKGFGVTWDIAAGYRRMTLAEAPSTDGMDAYLQGFTMRLGAGLKYENSRVGVFVLPWMAIGNYTGNAITCPCGSSERQWYATGGLSAGIKFAAL